MTWREEAAQIIREATRDLPGDTPLKERMRVVDAACPSDWRRVSWPQKAWQRARREYLVPFGYQPKTKAARQAGLPLFEDL